LLQLFTQVGGVNHGGIFVDRIREFFWRIDQHQFRASQSNRTVKGASPSHHNYFVFQAGSVGELPDVLVICPSHTTSCGSGHGAGCARCHDAGLRTGQLRKASSHRTLKIKNIDEVLACLELGFADFGKFERSAQGSPGSPAIDDGFHTQACIDILPWVFIHCGSGLRVKIASCNPADERRSRYQLYEGTTTSVLHECHRSLLVFSLSPHPWGAEPWT